MQNDTLETNAAIFRWSPRAKSVIVTSGSTQFELTASDSMNLLEMLYQHRSELFRASNGLPDWLDDEPTPGARLPTVVEEAASVNRWLDERNY